MKKIVGIGELLWDMFPAGKQLGGAPANFAYHVSQLGFDGYAISAMGPDELGLEIKEYLKNKKLNTLIEEVNYPTGTVQVELDSSGVPTYDICENAAWDNIPLTNDMKQLAKELDAVCFGTLAQRNHVSHQTISEFVDLVPEHSYKIFDINLRQHYYSDELIEQCMQKCNIMKINDDEIKVLMHIHSMPNTDEVSFCLYLMEKYRIELLILTKGIDGSYVFSNEGETSFKPTPKVDVIDTVGAGDSFTAGFVSALLNGKSIADAHELAVNVSAYVCTCKGAMPEISFKI